MTLRAIASIGVLVSFCAAAAPARALDDPDTEASRRHFAAGAELYSTARYEDAIVEFTAARKLRPSPALDYNIARCHDRLEHTTLAIEEYQRFLDHAPPGDRTIEAEQRLAVLRARVPAAVVEVRAPAPPPPRHRYPLVVPASVTALGVATLAVGGALYGVSGHRYDEITASGCGSSRMCFASTWNGTRTMERAGIGLLVTGGVVSVAAISLWGGWRSR